MTWKCQLGVENYGKMSPVRLKQCKIIRLNRFSTIGGSKEELKLGL